MESTLGTVGHRALLFAEGLPKLGLTRHLMAPRLKPQNRLLVPRLAFSKHRFWKLQPLPIGVWHPAALHFRRWVSWGWPRRVKKLLRGGLRLWLLSYATDRTQTHDILALRMPGIQSQTKNMCVGRRLGFLACQNQGVGENGIPLISLPLLLPHSRAQTPDQCVSNWVKEWEHGTMPHARDVRKPKHSPTLMCLIWFMKCNFCGILC